MAVSGLRDPAESLFFSLFPDGLQKEMDFRRDMANSIGLSINEIGIVGSAQLGYSIKPHVKLRLMDEEYGKTKKISDKSDIDVSVVSRKYFDQLHQEVHDYTKGFGVGWEFSKYYPTLDSMKHLDVKRADYNFYKYFAQGWLRPDFFPDGFSFGYNIQLNKWKKILDRKISIGIYRDWKCLKDYQEKAFESLRYLAVKDQL